MIIIGAGGHAREVIAAYFSQRRDTAETVWCLVEKGYPTETILSSIEVFCMEEQLSLYWKSYQKIVVAVGDPVLRKRLMEKSIALMPQRGGVHGLMLQSPVIHKSASVPPMGDVGLGSQVLAHATIGVHARVGESCIVNHGAVLCHDAVLEDYATVGPNATLCGGARALEGASVGAGAVVLPGITVGPWSTLGAGAVATRDIPDGQTWVGNPARMIHDGGPDFLPGGRATRLIPKG